jgi:hypothetical protein
MATAFCCLGLLVAIWLRDLYAVLGWLAAICGAMSSYERVSGDG